jgi:cytidylate kinase
MNHSPLNEDPGEPPRHGFQGDRGRSAPVRSVPAGLTVALTREAGARGGSIARRAGRKLGWQVYDQELLEYMARDADVCQNLVENLHSGVPEWIESRLRELAHPEEERPLPALERLARVVLALGARGGVVLIGRGAGYILPHESTLHVRVVAPLQERIAYMSQWLRLTLEEAAEKVRLRDQRRAEFVATHFHRRPEEIHQYDLVLNSSLLGEEICAELITQAARARSMQFAEGESDEAG